ncbi:MAG: flavin reductase family protein, partial [Bacteroidaceae bacterium]|nr:flavin reductase family protein [Bacteroidaceae bacterium]
MIKKDLTVLSQEDVFHLIGKEWMLITAGNIKHFNTMTASWGGLGWLWNKPVAFIFVRPER